VSSHAVLLDVRRRSLASGFYAAGESLAVDLVNTVKLKASPVLDLLEGRDDSFWADHGALLPSSGSTPQLDATRELRSAIRLLLEAGLDGREFDADAMRLVNTTAASSLPVGQLRPSNTGTRVTEVSVGAGDPLLAAAARSAIDSLSNLTAVRRCGSPRCSMLYVSESPARLWCSQTCGNRIRVARSQGSR
jgi:predicted RNA-binding Zn ribbon-like protein